MSIKNPKNKVIGTVIGLKTHKQTKKGIPNSPSPILSSTLPMTHNIKPKIYKIISVIITPF